MAGDEDRAEKYIMDIPYSVLFNIVQSLDADKGWEALASETGFTFDKIRLLELEGSRLQGSPSRSLLLELGSRNTTIRQLYSHLSAIRRYREMKMLEDYVNNPNPSARSLLSENHGLKGLKSYEPKSPPGDSLENLKGLKPPSVSVTPDKKGACGSIVCSDSINFNQPKSGCDVNNSMQLPEKDKRYTGKQMPVPTTHSSSGSKPSATSTDSRENINLNSIKAPAMKPCAAIPGKPVAVNKDIQKHISGEPASTFSSSSGQPACPVNRTLSHSSSSSSTPSPFSDIPSSSSLSSMPGLDSFPAWLDSSVEMQVAAIGSACFSYQELRQATGDFSEANKLGEGAFGTVYFGNLRHTKCAVKKMAEVHNQDTCIERSSQMKREMTSLLKFRHENLVTLYGYALDGPSLCLVYQYMPNGSLEDRLLCKNGTSPLLWSQRLNIMVGASQGLNFIHTMGQQPLIHGDIKSANILLDKHMEARLGDLGQAQQATGRDGGSGSSRLTHITRAQATTKLYGTRAYQPSEVQSGGKTSIKSDIFAMGVVLLEVFSGQQAYDDRREGDRGLADYFRNNVSEDELDKWLPQIDSRAGECPQEVSMAILQLAFRATSELKRNRPDSSKFLQEMTNIEQMYNNVTGLGAASSLVGSEHSCHMSHTSAPDNPRTDNLAGAPRVPPTAVNHNIHQGHHACPDNRLAVNLNSPSRENGQADDNQRGLESSTPSPIDYFPQGQPLPAPFRLQQEYDRQKMGQSEKKQISRLSECYPVRELSQVENQLLPEADPVKLAALEQFDRLNLGQHEGQGHDIDPAHLQSDPRKLAALKQFDSQNSMSSSSSGCNTGGEKEQDLNSVREGQLACDPKKMACLQQFDRENVTVGHVEPNSCHTSLREEASALKSDPKKLAYLKQFDENNSSVSSAASCVSSPGEDKESCVRSHDSFPISQVDYVVTPQRNDESAHHAAQCPTSTPGLCLTDCAPGSSVPGQTQCPEASTTVNEPSASAMLARQRNFFERYEQALQNIGYDEEEEDTMNEGPQGQGVEADEDDDGSDNDVDDNERREDVGVEEKPHQEMPVGMVGAGAQRHPDPSEQDEDSNINLDYFKERAQYYGKAFKKTLYASNC